MRREGPLSLRRIERLEEAIPMKQIVTNSLEGGAGALIKSSGDALSALTDVERLALAKHADILRVDRGARLIDEGDDGKWLYHLLQGAVQLTRISAGGDRLVAGFLFSGDFVGVCVADRYPFSAQAIDPSVICRYNRDAIASLRERHPGLEQRMLSAASNEFQQCLNHLEIVIGGSAETKLARFLLRLADRIGVSDATGRVIELPMRREDIADYLGHSAETTSRAFSSLRGSGAISTPHRSCVAIEDETILTAIAERLAS